MLTFFIKIKIKKNNLAFITVHCHISKVTHILSIVLFAHDLNHIPDNCSQNGN